MFNQIGINKLKLVILFLIVLLCAVNFCYAVGIDPGTVGNIHVQTEEFSDAAGFESGTTVGGVIAVVIKAFLGLLGMIFLILIITAGYNWMTAGGEEEKIKKAKDMIQRAIIGLIIIIAAYAITYFVFKNLGGVAGSGFQE